MSLEPNKTSGEALFNPYKRKADNGFLGMRSEAHKSFDMRSSAYHGSNTPAYVSSKAQNKPLDDLLFGKAAKTFTRHKHNNSAHLDGVAAGDPVDRKVFKFQMDPSFRNDLMKKRMTNKISIKEIVEENKNEASEPGVSGAMKYLQMKRQSLDVMRIAADKDEKEELKSKIGGPKSKMTGTNMIENMPHKNAIFGIIDHQKTLNLNKLKERKSAQDEEMANSKVQNNESRAARFSRAMERSKALKIDNRLLNEDIKRGAINVMRNSEMGVRQTIAEEDDNLLGKAEGKDRTAVLIKPDTSKSKRGLSFDKIFWKKSNSVVVAEKEEDRFQSSKQQGTIDQRRQRSQSREVHEVKTQTYYMVALKYNYKKKIVGPLAMIYREHFIQTMGAIKYLNSKEVNMHQYTDIDFVKGKLKSKNSNSLSFLTRTFTSENISSNSKSSRIGSVDRGFRFG